MSQVLGRICMDVLIIWVSGEICMVYPIGSVVYGRVGIPVYADYERVSVRVGLEVEW